MTVLAIIVVDDCVVVLLIVVVTVIVAVASVGSIDVVVAVSFVGSIHGRQHRLQPWLATCVISAVAHPSGGGRGGRGAQHNQPSSSSSSVSQTEPRPDPMVAGMTIVATIRKLVLAIILITTSNNN